MEGDSVRVGLFFGVADFKIFMKMPTVISFCKVWIRTWILLCYVKIVNLYFMFL